MPSELFFPEGPGGICHPLNVGGFNLGHPDCAGLYGARNILDEGWDISVLIHARLAHEGWNCSSAQQCALGQLFLTLGALTTPGFYGTRQPPVLEDRWRARLWRRMSRNAMRAQKQELLRLLRQRFAELRAASATVDELPLAPGTVTLGIHADERSAAGPWRGQLEVWRGYAMTHGLRWLLDTERYFNGTVFANYMGWYWASADSSRNSFWQRYSFLVPRPDVHHPIVSFSEATTKDPQLLDSLAVFTQPPAYWDSLEALRAAVPQNQWTVWIDYDLSLSPCCFDAFSFVEFIDGGHRQGRRAELPHVIIRDSPHEDYSHHCANAGFLVVRNSAVGRLFIELAMRKRLWPAVPYGYQGALAEALLELLGLERAVLGSGERGHGAGGSTSSSLEYDSRCMPYLVLGSPRGHMSYANFCHCYRNELRRLAGPDRARGTRWVKFLEPHHGQEAGLLLASLFLYRAGHNEMGTRGVGVLPQTTWSKERHRSYVDAWLPWDPELGGPCAILPLVIHWASLPFKPRLIYDFMNARFPEELPLALLANGSAEALAAGYRAAGARGKALWEAFLAMPMQSRHPVSWPGAEGNRSSRLTRAACFPGSARMWEAGGWPRWGRTTDVYAG